MKFNKLYLILFLFAAGIFTSCEKDDPEVEYTSTFPVNGEWYVTYNVKDDATGEFQDLIGTHVLFYTYNTSENNGQQIWIDDHGTWPFKIKANVNVSERTFSASQATSTEGDTIQVDIMNGGVFVDGGQSLTGVVTDSIYMEAMFSDDPGTTYYIMGHRRTGFQEDEF